MCGGPGSSPGRPFAERNARTFFDPTGGFPPAGTQVWLGYTEVARPQVVVQPSQLGTRGRSLARVEGYCVTFNVHHLVFQVAYLPEPLDPRRESRQDWEKYLVQLWPMNYRVVTIPSEVTPPLDEIAGHDSIPSSRAVLSRIS